MNLSYSAAAIFRFARAKRGVAKRQLWRACRCFVLSFPKMWNYSALSDVLYGGIRPDVPGHGGEECAAYLSKRTMLFETFLSTSMMVTVGVFGAYTYTMPKFFLPEKHANAKRVLLVVMCLIFGVEIGYKICSRQVLYLLNPCHVITAIEVKFSSAENLVACSLFSDILAGLQP